MLAGGFPRPHSLCYKHMFGPHKNFFALIG